MFGTDEYKFDLPSGNSTSYFIFIVINLLTYILSMKNLKNQMVNFSIQDHCSHIFLAKLGIMVLKINLIYSYDCWT